MYSGTSMMIPDATTMNIFFKFIPPVLSMYCESHTQSRPKNIKPPILSPFIYGGFLLRLPLATGCLPGRSVWPEHCQDAASNAKLAKKIGIWHSTICHRLIISKPLHVNSRKIRNFAALANLFLFSILSSLPVFLSDSVVRAGSLRIYLCFL